MIASRPGAEGEPVIGPSGAVRITVATKPLDCRKGMEGPIPWCARACGLTILWICLSDPSQASGSDELVFWEETGLCLFAKRLEDGIFRWSKIETE